MIGAGVSLAVAIVAATVIDRFLARRGRQFAQAVSRGDVSPVVDTRLRLLRRIVVVVIVLIGIFSALSQFAELRGLAASVLTSGAIAAAVIGFAARQVLANAIAGLILAATQPLRIGDWVEFGDDQGVVEDVRLNSTILRTPSDRRVIIPNEKLVTGVLRNDSLAGVPIGVEVAIWLPPEADPGKAIAALRDELGDEVSLSIAEAVPWGTRLAVGGGVTAPPKRVAAEAKLREWCLARLRADGLLASEREQT